MASQPSPSTCTHVSPCFSFHPLPSESPRGISHTVFRLLRVLDSLVSSLYKQMQLDLFLFIIFIITIIKSANQENLTHSLLSMFLRYPCIINLPVWFAHIQKAYRWWSWQYKLNWFFPILKSFFPFSREKQREIMNLTKLQAYYFY